MAVQRALISSRIALDHHFRRLRLPGLGNFLADRPSLWIVVSQVLSTTDPTKDHRLGEEKLLWPDREVNEKHDERDKSNPRQAMQYIHHAPRLVAKKIGIAREEWRAHSKHHKEAGENHRKTRE